jgi:TrmH family RNA methyltransferase
MAINRAVMLIRELTSLQHPLIKHFVKLQRESDYRYEKKSIVVEGIKPIREIAGRCRIKTLIATDRAIIPEDISIKTEVFLVTASWMEKASGMKSPEGLLAEVQMPEFHSLQGMRWILALDGINEPGNMGTLLRTALAFGWEGVFILKNSCDPYNEKVIKASRGALFRLPMRRGDWKELDEIIRRESIQPIAADLTGAKPEEIEECRGRVLVLGNEARGISEEAKQTCLKVTLPMRGDMESLNVAVAGGILMYLLKK